MLLGDKTVKATIGIFLASVISTSAASTGWSGTKRPISLSMDRLSPTAMGTLTVGSNSLIGLSEFGYK